MGYKSYLVLFLFCSLFFSSCSKSNSTDEFSVNKALWNGKNILNYTYTMRIVCFCPPARLGPNIVRVVNGKLASVNGLPYDENTTGKLYSISAYFDFVNSMLAEKPFRSNVSYNPKYGYPEIVYFDFREAVADDETRYAITSFIVN